MKIDKNKLFEKSGYYNMPYVIGLPYTFTLIIGARGTGKTYGANKYLIESGLKFMYLRRTDTEHDIAVNDHTNPFLKYDPEIYAEKIKKGMCAIKKDDTIIGYSAPLSTFHNLRGIDFSDVQIIVYDECIPENHVRSIKNEYDVILNMYESINRNRELDGIKPVKLIMLSNSNKLDTPIITGMKVANALMQGKEIIADNARSLLVLNIVNKGFSEKKGRTALYRLADDNTGFKRMALGNEFYGADTGGIEKVNSREYNTVCTLVKDNVHLYINVHKRDNTVHVSTSDNLGGGNDSYNIEYENEKLLFLRKYQNLVKLLINKKITFDTMDTKLLFENILKCK